MSQKPPPSHIRLVYSAPNREDLNSKSTISLADFCEGRLTYAILDAADPGEPVAQVLSFRRDEDIDHSLEMPRTADHAAKLFQPLGAIIRAHGDASGDANERSMLRAELDEPFLEHPLRVDASLQDGSIQITMRTLDMSKAYQRTAVLSSLHVEHVNLDTRPALEDTLDQSYWLESTPSVMRPLVVGALALAYNCLLPPQSSSPRPIIELSPGQRVSALNYLGLPVRHSR